MSTAWMQMVEPAAHATSTPKYEDVMAEFRANGQDLESTSSRSSQGSAGPNSAVVQNNPGSAPGVQVQNSQAVSQSVQVQPQPCSLCGTVPQSAANNDFSKEISNAASLTNIDMLEFQQHFGAGLRKFLDKPTVNQQDASWPFVRKDIAPLNPNAALNNIEQLWQLNATNQYARPTINNMQSINGLNLLKLNQLRNKTIVECVFCRNNGEPVNYYRTHELKDEFGRVTCPVLRTFRCPCCGATGDNAHTIKYCPEKPPEFLPTFSQLKQLRIVPKRRVSLPRRITGSQELGNWLNTDQ